MELPPDWREAAERIAAGTARRVLLLGAPDVGKSSLRHALLERLARTGREVALLDADPAQKLVGPPACATLGRCTRGRALSLRLIAFVGTLNPLQGWRRLVAGTRRLAAEAGTDLLLVNTSGLLAGAGRRLKAAKIAAVRPDLLVALGTTRRCWACSLTTRPSRPCAWRARPRRGARPKASGEPCATTPFADISKAPQPGHWPSKGFAWRARRHRGRAG